MYQNLLNFFHTRLGQIRIISSTHSMATIIYYAGLDYDLLPTAKKRKTDGYQRKPYVNPAYHSPDYCNSLNSASSNSSSNYSSQDNTHSSDLNNSNQENTITDSYNPNCSNTHSSNSESYSNFSNSNRSIKRVASDLENLQKPTYARQESYDQQFSSNDRTSNQRQDYAKKTISGQVPFRRVSSNNPPDQKLLLDTLKQYFKFDQFRENQLESVIATCQGSDTLILMPTGGGKSICYQLPAILSNGLTIVVSPLKSLIADQVNRLQSLNVKTSALFGETKENEASDIYSDLRQDFPEHKLLYVTPEKINASNYLMSIFQTLYERGLLARFVIDEAHCVSTWGADFRPDYRKLGKLRDLFPTVPIMALTATAPPKVRDDILDQLRMNKDLAKVFIQSFNRPNLKFEVRDKSKGCLKDICNMIRANFSKQCGIIYCLSRNDCEQVASNLREQGITSAPYHAGLSDDSRKRVFSAWSRGTFQVVCATIAFGMGIDKSDVRFVIHYSMPKSIEGYYQEAGRAGRDGNFASCILFFSRSDLYRMKSMLNKTGFGRKVEDKKRDVGNLQHMIDYVDNKNECRRTILLRYLGENFDSADCIKHLKTACDNCLTKGGGDWSFR